MATHTEKQMTNDYFETKLHILKAGRELLLAAEGALRFCKQYVQSGQEPERNPELAQFFARALDAVRELGAGFQVSPKHRQPKKKKRR